MIYNRISKIYHRTGGILGYRSMRVFLSREEIFLSTNTVHKYMNKDVKLFCICRRKRPDYRKGKVSKLFPNLINQNFYVQKPDSVWCTDFTYLFLSNGTLRYNCTVIDLYDRSVVASETGKRIDSDLAIKTVQKALMTLKSVPEKLILHSDQGPQFTSKEFTEYCLSAGIMQSMSRAGCPYDNAPMERYYNTLKAELINRFSFRTDKELVNAISEYAYVWYNKIRPHSYNNYLTPFQVRFKFSIFI